MMMFIRNFDSLAKTETRKACLKILETGLESIQPQKVIQENISFKGEALSIQNQKFNLKNFKRLHLLGFGKGSGGISKSIEELLANKLENGFVIDLEAQEFSKIKFTKGTHPLPSQENLSFTKKSLTSLISLTEKDLVIVVIAGGGSALFEDPYKIDLEKLIEVNKALLKCGANIYEMNVVRKHLSKVKGGGLAKLLYPAKVVSIIASDVPGNDLSVIASGPTVKDPSTKKEAFAILKKFDLWEKLELSEDDFLETPKEDKYFKNVSNTLILSNLTPLMAMQKKAKELGFNAIIYSDKFQGEARFVGKELMDKTPPHHILLAAGETIVKVKGNGKGGRNQELVLGAISDIPSGVIIASCATDGWDNSPHAGAIGDIETVKKAKKIKLNPERFLDTNNSFKFFKKTGDNIVTGRLPSNVSDLMIVVKN